ncbi:MAG: hypothetical protein ACREPR_25185 [Brasilonema sp.]
MTRRHSLPKALGISVVLGFLVAICVFKFYWGYLWFPPALPKKVFDFEKILSITPVSSHKKDDGRFSFTIDDLKFCLSPIQSGIKESKDCSTIHSPTQYHSSTRILWALSKRNKLPTTTAYISLERLASLYSNLEATKLLYQGQPGYNDAKLLEGIIVEAEDREKQRYLFVAVNGKQVSNDHYPYYEFLFLLRGASRPQLLSVNRFFYDIAGLEGTELYFFLIPWIFFMVVFISIFLLLGVAVLLVQHLRHPYDS